MGFGVLFIGYLFFFNFVQGTFTDVFGALFLIYALYMLRRNAPYFGRAYALTIPYAAYSGGAFIWKMLTLLNIIPTNELAVTWIDFVGNVFRLALIVLLLRAIQRIGLETGVQHIVVQAFRNRIFTYIFYGCWLALTVTHGIATDGELAAFLNGASIAMLIVGLVYHFLNAKLVFSCYMWICLEGDEEMQRKESKNPFVNMVNRATDKVEDRMLERKRREAEEKALQDKLHPHKQRKSEKRKK